MNERRSFHVVLYSIPAIMDCVAGIFSFIGPVRAALLGYDPLVAGSTVSVRAFFIFVTGLIVARFLTPARARPMMIVSVSGLILVCLLGLTATNLTMLYVTSALAGLCHVGFVTSFQVFMAIVGSGDTRPLSRVMGTFNASWCTGQAFGPFITGALMELGKPADGVGLSVGWIYTYLTAGGLAGVVVLALVWIGRAATGRLQQHIDTIAGSEDGEEQPPMNLAWLGWLTAIFGIMSLGMVRGLFPATVTGAGMAEWLTGLVMMLMSISMGWVSYVVALRSANLYSGLAMLVMSLIGCAGLLFYVIPVWLGWELAAHVWPYIVASLAFGGFAGVVYLFSAYHCLTDPVRAGQNISLNETAIAVGMMTGPLIGGWLARVQDYATPFIVFIGVTFALGLFQYFTLSRHRKADG